MHEAYCRVIDLIDDLLGGSGGAAVKTTDEGEFR